MYASNKGLLSLKKCIKNMARRRSNIEIIGEMLRLGENGAGKTQLMYGANLSYIQIQKYLGFLTKHGFIDKLVIGNPSVTYHVTDKGRGLLNSIESVLEVLELNDATGLE
jgi:predicted transcriptional regulator